MTTPQEVKEVAGEVAELLKLLFGTAHNVYKWSLALKRKKVEMSIEIDEYVAMFQELREIFPKIEKAKQFALQTSRQDYVMLDD